ncbi:hypothetical protein SAMN02910357_02052 [Succinivibrio dextrinosolvens]|nr:hypothetical protein SAMN02910357_02052 [Succinivibrio dextrinosolvens]
MDSQKNMTFPNPLKNIFGKIIVGLIALYVFYVFVVGLFSSTCPAGFNPPKAEDIQDDRARATVMAEATVHALDTELRSLFGWIPNDLFFVPKILDNIVNYQKGVIYATRPASDMIAKTVSRYGKNDTLDPRLVDATSRSFVYSDEVWGFWFIYDTEGKYKQGIQNWRSWAASVDSGVKNAGIYNVKSDDVYQILKYCNQMLEYALGYLNKEKIKHLDSDNYVYFAKGVSSVVENILRGLVAVDASVIQRGGQENVDAALNRLAFVRDFNPWYVVAGGNDEGDAMLPNHVAAIARHIDVASNRINDIMQSMEK